MQRKGVFFPLFTKSMVYTIGFGGSCMDFAEALNKSALP